MFLGIDLGTSNIKAMVVDRSGAVVSTGSASVGRRCTPDDGIEQDLEEIWQATCLAIRRAVSCLSQPGGTEGLRPTSIEALGVSSQGGALQLFDDRLRPIGPIVSWMDGRGRAFDQSLIEELGQDYFVDHVGCRNCMITPGQILRLRQQAPAQMREAAAIGYVGDAIVHRLCGRRVHDATSLSIAFLYNPALGRADPDLLQRLGLRDDMLPELAPADRPAGNVLAAAAEATGLPEGIPVSPAVHDQYAASLGVGAVREGDVSLGTGTAWAMIAHSGRLMPPVTRQAIVCQHPVRGLFGQMLSMVNGGSTIEWVVRVTGRPLTGAQLDAAVAAVPAGSDGLVFWPHMVRLGGIDAATQPGGRLSGLTLAHGPDHLLRAAVEGLACELARHLQAMAEGGHPVRRVLLSGGAAVSGVTPQIIADATGRPVAAVTEPAVSALGAAILARAMVEPGAGLDSLAERFCAASVERAPGADASVYARLLQRFLEGATNRP